MSLGWRVAEGTGSASGRSQVFLGPDSWCLLHHFLTSATWCHRSRAGQCLLWIHQEEGLGGRQPHLVAAGSKAAHQLPQQLPDGLQTFGTGGSPSTDTALFRGWGTSHASYYFPTNNTYLQDEFCIRSLKAARIGGLKGFSLFDLRHCAFKTHARLLAFSHKWGEEELPRAWGRYSISPRSCWEDLPKQGESRSRVTPAFWVLWQSAPFSSCSPCRTETCPLNSKLFEGTAPLWINLHMFSVSWTDLWASCPLCTCSFPSLDAKLLTTSWMPYS